MWNLESFPQSSGAHNIKSGRKTPPTPRKLTCPQNGTILQGNFIVQPSSFEGYAVFRWVIFVWYCSIGSFHLSIFFREKSGRHTGVEKKRIYENQTQVVQDWIQPTAPTHLLLAPWKTRKNWKMSATKRTLMTDWWKWRRPYFMAYCDP